MKKISQGKAENVNFWHLYVFRTVVAAGGLAAGGRQVKLTQPAVSHAVAGLERQFSARLIIRANSALGLTREGSLVDARAARALELLVTGLRDAADLSPRAAIQRIRAVSAARLRGLVEIVRHGSFAVAARASGIATPTLHRAARDLESSLGVDLFEATSFGVKPSRRAEVLSRYASLAFSEIRQTYAEIADLAGAGSGETVSGTVIGAMPLARSHLVPAAVQAFTEYHPHHRVTILEGAYDDLVVGLRRGDVDFLVGAMRGERVLKDLTEEKLFDDPLSLVMRAGHPVLTARRLTSKSLRAWPWVAPRRDSPLRRNFHALFSPEPPPENLIECNSLSAARVILMESDRLMLLSEMQIKYEKAAGLLMSRPLKSRSMQRPIGVTTRSQWLPTPVQKALMNEIVSFSA
ncbi:MAG: LysR family transcriptional regulator [Parvularculaceae bacterium]